MKIVKIPARVWPGLLVAGALSLAVPAIAQTADTVKLSALKSSGTWGDKRGLTLTGSVAQPARIIHPQLDVAAPLIEVSFDAAGQLSQVKASGGVKFMVNLTQKGGGATRIDARSDTATLTRTADKRTLALNGKVDGTYQIGNGLKQPLKGDSVLLTSVPSPAANAPSLIADIKGSAEGLRFELPGSTNAAGQTAPGPVVSAQNAHLEQVGPNLNIDLDGGTRPVRVDIPAPDKADNNNDALSAIGNGPLVITAQRAMLRQGENIARFIGNAHATSGTPTPNAPVANAPVATAPKAGTFDITAGEFTLIRAADGILSTLKTSGRTKVKLDIPQEAAAAPKPGAKPDSSPGGLRPTYLEVEADGANANLETRHLLFEGNVKGIYRLPSAANGAANAPAGGVDYPFSGQRLTLSQTPGGIGPARGFNLSIEGQTTEPAVIIVPGLKFDDF